MSDLDNEHRHMIVVAIRAAEALEAIIERNVGPDDRWFAEFSLSVIRMQLLRDAWQFLPPSQGPTDEEIDRILLDARRLELGETRPGLQDEFELDTARMKVELHDLADRLRPKDR